MIVKVVFLRSAEADLKELRSYLLKNFGNETWQACYSKIKESVAVIESFPAGGQIPDELVRLGLNQYRQVISGMNRIIYEVRGDIAYVHIVCDTRKDLRSMLTRRLLRAL
ncbi:MAG TPA: type II toxin-antitoxin system RelE/ParE family toxin [Trinickia sp.]|nr:type II toxin-antitoxin system RelE/ParE family toxin [Trinickia sp.]